MRLYLNNKEVDIVKEALTNQRTLYFGNNDTFAMCSTILDRIRLCEELQNNERKGAKMK